MTTTLAISHPVDALAVTSDQLELIRRTIAKDATPDELRLYLFDCHRQGVHPLDKLIHFTKRSGKYTPITSIDFMRIRAAESGEMAGSDDPVFTSHDDAGYDAVDAATVTVYRLTQGQRFAYTATARWSEYKPEQNDFMWRRMPHTMLGKCAEALALRKGFPRQLAGLYAKEELDQANTEPVIQIREAPALPEKREKPSVPNGGDSGQLVTERIIPIEEAVMFKKDDGPDLGVDLPPGTVRIATIGAGKGSALAEVTLSTGESYMVWRSAVLQTAKDCFAAQTPVAVELKTSASGNIRIEAVTPVVF